MKRGLLWSSVFSVFVACGGADNRGYSLIVGGDEGGAGPFSGGDAAVAADLDAYIEQGQVAVKIVTVSCSGDCVTVEAVGTGGHAPYTFRWEDGSNDAVRRVCPAADTGYAVTVTDTGAMGEFPRPPQTARASVTANVLSCPDGGATCVLDAAAVVSGLPQSLAIDTTGSVEYFANGASLPAGRYRIEYVDGCMQYGGDIANVMQWGWTIHTGPLAGNPALSGSPYSGDCVLVGATSADVVAVLPGTTAPPPGIATYADCVTSNKAKDAPLDFDFAGGKLGLFVEDLLAGDDVGGASAGGVSPTWNLTALGACE
jgi:hypothetical protein